MQGERNSEQECLLAENGVVLCLHISSWQTLVAMWIPINAQKFC